LIDPAIQIEVCGIPNLLWQYCKNFFEFDTGVDGHQQHAAIAIPNVGGMHDGGHQQTLCIDEDVALLAFDLLATIEA